MDDIAIFHEFAGILEISNLGEWTEAHDPGEYHFVDYEGVDLSEDLEPEDCTCTDCNPESE